MNDLRSMTLTETEELLQNVYGEKKYRALQIYEWINKKLVSSFDEMTNISKGLRQQLSRDSAISKALLKEKLDSKDGATIKCLFELEKDTIIESVLMRYSYGNSVCVSSQAGCRMACTFCASALDGLQRNLTAGEICAQVYGLQKVSGERISNIVVMGVGEPFDNYDNLLKFIKIITSKQGLGIGARHITVSTCGLADKILLFARENLQVNLAVSLHAPTDDLRKQLMPVANKYGVNDILAAARKYSSATGRRVTYEYALISGINDSVDCAHALGRKLCNTLAHVNLIPINEITETNYSKSDKQTTRAFARILEASGIKTTVRRELGGDISSACGQLRRRNFKTNSKLIE